MFYIKVYICSFLAIFFIIGQNCVFSQQDRRSRWGSTPSQIFENVAGKTNEDLRIQETRLNNIDGRGQYSRQYRIANTLDSIRNNISPYLQRFVYIGLTLAVLLIIYNGFLLVSSGISGKEEGAVMTNIKNISLGVAIMLGFVFIIKLGAIIINALSNQTY